MNGVRFTHVEEWALTLFEQGEGLVKIENIELSDKWKDAF
jgi:hypothetical protein